MPICSKCGLALFEGQFSCYECDNRRQAAIKEQHEEIEKRKLERKEEKERNKAIKRTSEYNPEMENTSKKQTRDVNLEGIWSFVGFGAGAYIPYYLGYNDWVQLLLFGLLGCFIGYKMSNALSWILVIGTILSFALMMYLTFR